MSKPFLPPSRPNRREQVSSRVLKSSAKLFKRLAKERSLSISLFLALVLDNYAAEVMRHETEGEEFP